MIGRAAQRCSWDRPCVSAMWQLGRPLWSTQRPLWRGHRGIAECSRARLRGPCPMNRTVNTTTTSHGAIRGVHDRIDILLSDVPLTGSDD